MMHQDEIALCRGTSLLFPVAVSRRVMSATVETIYTQSKGAGSKHAWVPAVDSLSSPSYIVVQIFEHHSSPDERQVRSAISLTGVILADFIF